MAQLSEPDLFFDRGCPDCGERRIRLPLPFPGVGDDLDWLARDYDSLRLFMMQELAHRYPHRKHWTPADMEVVLVEVLAAALDRVSHTLDAIQAERFLETAKRPQSVRRLLKLIGYDGVVRSPEAIFDPASTLSLEDQLEAHWRAHPEAMEAARQAGPRLTGEQLRMVTLADHETLMTRHPLVARAKARLIRTTAWSSILIAILPEAGHELDTPLFGGPGTIAPELWREVLQFHSDLRLPLRAPEDQPTPREILRTLIERYRMVGSELFLENAKPAPITFTLSVRLKPGYFRSEMRHAITALLSAEQGGFFEPGHYGFGQDIFASDIFDVVMALDGLESACLNRFKRVGTNWPDRAGDGIIPMGEHEYVQCENDRAQPDAGHYRLVLHGGEAG